MITMYQQVTLMLVVIFDIHSNVSSNKFILQLLLFVITQFVGTSISHFSPSWYDTKTVLIIISTSMDAITTYKKCMIKILFILVDIIEIYSVCETAAE